jgi:hypothetical protein
MKSLLFAIAFAVTAASTTVASAANVPDDSMWCSWEWRVFCDAYGTCVWRRVWWCV